MAKLKEGMRQLKCGQRLLLLVSALLLFLVLFVPGVFAEASYVMSEQQKIELLSSIKQMKSELANIKEQLQTSIINLRQAQLQLDDLKKRYQEQLYQTEVLSVQSEELKQSFEEWKKISTDFQKEINWLKIQRWLFLFGGFILGKVL